MGLARERGPNSKGLTSTRMRVQKHDLLMLFHWLERQCLLPRATGLHDVQLACIPTEQCFGLSSLRFIIHGTRDEIVPVWHGQAIFADTQTVMSDDALRSSTKHA